MVLVRKTLALLAGCAIVVLALEGGLRVFGAWYTTRLTSTRAYSAPGSNEFRVLCLGDSFTQGIGAAPSNSFPAQLERMLARRARRPVRVINCGVAAHSTSDILAHLNADLAAVRPDVVVLLCGGVNIWNQSGYRGGVRGWLDRSALVRFTTLLFQNVRDRQRTPDGADAKTVLEEENRSRDHDLLMRRVRARGDSAARIGFAQFHLMFGESRKGVCELEKLISTNGSVAQAGFVLADYYEQCGLLTRACELYQQAWSNGRAHAICAIRAGEAYRELGDATSAADWYRKGLVTIPALADDERRLSKEVELLLEGEQRYYERPWYRQLRCDDLTLLVGERSTRTRILDWVERDVDRIIDRCREHGSAVIVHTYPIRHNGMSSTPPVLRRAVNDVLRRVADRAGAVCVDQAAAFAREESDRVFQPAHEGEHPNAEGYGMMARALAEAILTMAPHQAP
jgi:lysophospholipase L1-like esterase